MKTIDWPTVACCANGDHECICGPDERAIRAVIRGEITMTETQREYCLAEIGQVEGYDRAEHVSDTDVQLARNVLGAWTDFARDKGML
jgi:hypothetical protein